MNELSLHILDIVQNSISANATWIEITITEDEEKDLLLICIEDNGKGMTIDFLNKVTDPFVTSRNTRKVGLGISLFKAAAEQCDGSFNIESQLGQGTKVTAKFKRSHIDRAPLGNIADTMITIIMSNAAIDYKYSHTYNDKVFVFNTQEIRNILGDVPLDNLDVIDWIKNHFQEGIHDLKNQKG
ncbi:MAG: ATP-binding protein [Bacillota bacterium]